MIASAQTLRIIKPVDPFEERGKFNGMSFGLSAASYDIRLDAGVRLLPSEFKLASSIEKFTMPNNLLGIVHDKSTWARLGVAVQNTVIDPGWIGFLTLELTNHSFKPIHIPAGSPIAQIVFHLLDHPTEQPYAGKYQNQSRGPVSPILEH